MKCRSRNLAVYNSEFILAIACVGSENHCETTKALKICCLFNINHIHFKIVLPWLLFYLLKTRWNFNKSVMVSVAVSSLGASNIHILKSRVKINGRTIVTLFWHRCCFLTFLKHLEASFFVFQQDSAPSRRAKDTVALLDQETPNFIPPALWPPNSPDLNLVDYAVWSVLQERVYRSKISNVNKLKRRVNSAALSHTVIERAVGEWHRPKHELAFVLEVDILSTRCSLIKL